MEGRSATGSMAAASQETSPAEVVPEKDSKIARSFVLQCMSNEFWEPSESPGQKDASESPVRNFQTPTRSHSANGIGGQEQRTVDLWGNARGTDPLSDSLPSTKLGGLSVRSSKSLDGLESTVVADNPQERSRWSGTNEMPMPGLGPPSSTETTRPKANGPIATVKKLPFRRSSSVPPGKSTSLIAFRHHHHIGSHGKSSSPQAPLHNGGVETKTKDFPVAQAEKAASSDAWVHVPPQPPPIPLPKSIGEKTQGARGTQVQRFSKTPASSGSWRSGGRLPLQTQTSSVDSSLDSTVVAIDPLPSPIADPLPSPMHGSCTGSHDEFFSSVVLKSL